MKQIETINLLDLDKTIAKSLFEKYLYPYEVLPEIKDYILEIGKTLSLDEYDLIDDNIWISKSVKKYATVTINGPAIIGHDTELRPGAWIRGSVIIGNSCVVGNSTEVKNSIIFDNVQIPHYNYVGDSILGYKSHLGAGVITSNIKSDKTNIVLKMGLEVIETNLRKFGAIVGDNVEIGCQTVLNPGTIIGRNTNIYPLSSVRGYVKEKSILKLIQEQQIVVKEDKNDK